MQLKQIEKFRIREIKERIKFYKSNPETFLKLFDSDKYVKLIDDVERILKKLPNFTPGTNEKKFICKVCKDPEVRKQFPEFYDNLKSHYMDCVKIN